MSSMQEAAFCRNLGKYHFGLVCATPFTKTFILKEFCIRGKKEIEIKLLTERPTDMRERIRTFR